MHNHTYNTKTFTPSSGNDTWMIVLRSVILGLLETY